MAVDNQTMTRVSIIIGSKSDTELGEKAAEMLDEFQVPYELDVISAHRNPEKLASHVENSDADVYICVAGLAAALPGAVQPAGSPNTDTGCWCWKRRVG